MKIVLFYSLSEHYLLLVRVLLPLQSTESILFPIRALSAACTCFIPVAVDREHSDHGALSDVVRVLL